MWWIISTVKITCKVILYSIQNFVFQCNFHYCRVVNVSSLLGVLKIVKNEDVRKELLDSNVTIETVSSVIQQYIQWVFKIELRLLIIN